MNTYRYVIIGGGMAGGRGADGIRKVDENGPIVLITGENHKPYDRPPLSKGYLIGTEGLDKVYLREDAHYEQSRIDVITGTWAVRLDPALHEISLSDGRTLRYEKLLLATGGTARRLPIPGSEPPLAKVFTLRTLDDADAIRAAAGPGVKVVIIGGSFIGAEVAASLSQIGAEVTIIFPGPRLFHRIAPADLSAHLHSLFANRGITIRPGTRPARFVGKDYVEGVELETGDIIPADMVIEGVGITLNSQLAQHAGLKMSADGGVVVDEFLRTSAPDIYAAGDIANWPDPTFGVRLRVEHWDVARTQGLRAGRNMAGEEKPYTTLPYFYSDLFHLNIEAWGILEGWDTTVLRGSLAHESFAYFYFSRGKLTGALTVGRSEAERKTIQTLLKTTPAYEDVASKLADESEDLNTLTHR